MPEGHDHRKTTTPESPAGQAALARLLKEYSPLAIAFSGGLDSRFLAFMAKRMEEDGVMAHLYFLHGPQAPSSELDKAQSWAGLNGLPFTALELNPLTHPDVRSNTPERCYHCKQLLFQGLRRELEKNPPFPGRNLTVCDGSNASDREVYRPGQRALTELSVRSPLAESGLSKKDIRALGGELGLDNPGQFARPCLLTRYAYGLNADTESLQALALAEDALQHLLAKAAASHKIPAPPDFRLRLVSGPARETTPRISGYKTELHISGPMPPEDICDALAATVMEQGFSRPGLRILEAVSGFYDQRRNEK